MSSKTSDGKQGNMPRVLPAVLMIVCVLHASSKLADADEPVRQAAAAVKIDKAEWPWWRGPNRDGLADPNQDPPLSWSETENVLWKVKVPGRGHSSPIVFGDQVFLTTADHDRDLQSVLAYDRKTGRLNWESVVHRGGLMEGNKKASQASPSVACDGERVFVNFLNDGAVYTTALDLKGNSLWQTKITNYKIHQGYGSSPAIYDSLVIVSADNKAGGAIAGLDRVSGDIVWSISRPKKPNYASPVILNAAGRDQLVFTGCDLVTSLNPKDGKTLWEIPGATTECVTSTVTQNGLVFTSGGYPKNHVSAVRADGSGEKVWELNVRVYVPSMLARDGVLFATADGGVAYCWEASTGKELWKHRLGGGFTASPVAGRRSAVRDQRSRHRRLSSKSPRREWKRFRTTSWVTKSTQRPQFAAAGSTCGSRNERVEVGRRCFTVWARSRRCCRCKFIDSFERRVEIMREAFSSWIALWMLITASTAKAADSPPKRLTLDRPSDEFLEMLDATNLRFLNIRNGRDLTDAGFEAIGKFPELTTLYIHRSAATDKGLAHFSKLKKLRSLSIRLSPQYTEAGLAHLKTLKQLTRLEFSGTLEGKGVLHLKEFRELQSLQFNAGDLDPGVTQGAGHAT